MSDVICHAREVLDTVDAVVWEADPATFRFSFVSAGAERLLGYPVAQWLAESDFWVARLLHPDDRAPTEAVRRDAARAGHGHQLEYRVVAADGRVVWVRDVARMLPVGPGGRPVLRGVMVDVTAQKQLEAELAQAQKMEAVGQLAGGIAHDFNNLLTVINGNADLALADLAERESPEDEGLVELIGEIRAGAERATELTRQLLAFGRKQKLRVRPTTLNEVMVDGLALIRRSLTDDIVIDAHLADEADEIRVDPTQLQRALLNLAVNARDAMRESAEKRLTIVTTTVDARDAHSGTSTLAPRSEPADPVTRDVVARANALLRSGRAGVGLTAGRYAMLAMRDTGRGMTNAVRERVFEPFFTTKRGSEGLGLSSAYGVVTQSGGYLLVDSEPGAGATFVVLLPVAERGDPRAEDEVRRDGGAVAAIDP